LHWISLHWEQAGSGRMLTLTSLTIWLRWEQAVSGGSDFAGRGETTFAGSSGTGFDSRGETGFAGSKLLAVDLTSLGAS